MLFPTVYPITDAHLSGLPHAEQVRQLVDAGARVIQLREKSLPPKAFYPDFEEAIGIARQNGVIVVVNDRVDVALALGADGVHLGQDDLPPAEARKLLGNGKLIGYSTHSLAQAKAALDEPIDYIAIGPVFSTSTKENPDPVVGPEMVARVRDLFGPDFPLVAIGGIGPANIKSVLDAGATSAAVIGSLFSEGKSIGENYPRLISAA